MTVYLTYEDILDTAQEALLGQQVVVLAGEQLRSAVVRPQMSVFGDEAYPSVFDKAGTYLHSLVLWHCLQDGNKRTGWLAAVSFLLVNGYDLEVTLEQAEEFTCQIADEKLEVIQIATWLSHHARPLDTGA